MYVAYVVPFYLSSKLDGEDGGGLGGPVGAVMVVVMMMSPLFLLPSEQILVAQRNTAVILPRERCKKTGTVREKRTDTTNYVFKHFKQQFSGDAVRRPTHLTEAINDN